MKTVETVPLLGAWDRADEFDEFGVVVSVRDVQVFVDEVVDVCGDCFVPPAGFPLSPILDRLHTLPVR